MTLPLVQLVLAGAKLSAPGTLLITLVKSLAGALVQRFRRVLAGNFEISEDLLRKIVHQRNSWRFPTNYQYLGCCTRFCNSEQQPQEGGCWPVIFKISEDLLRKIVHQRTSGRFPANYQYLGWCTLFCTSEQQPHQLGDGPCQ
jgi:hypothetical protein